MIEHLGTGKCGDCGWIRHVAWVNGHAIFGINDPEFYSRKVERCEDCAFWLSIPTCGAPVENAGVGS